MLDTGKKLQELHDAMVADGWRIDRGPVVRFKHAQASAVDFGDAALLACEPGELGIDVEDGLLVCQYMRAVYAARIETSTRMLEVWEQRERELHDEL